MATRTSFFGKLGTPDYKRIQSQILLTLRTNGQAQLERVKGMKGKAAKTFINTFQEKVSTKKLLRIFKQGKKFVEATENARK
jgi:hypothetical protein